MNVTVFSDVFVSTEHDLDSSYAGLANTNVSKFNGLKYDEVQIFGFLIFLPVCEIYILYYIMCMSITLLSVIALEGEAEIALTFSCTIIKISNVNEHSWCLAACRTKLNSILTSARWVGLIGMSAAVLCVEDLCP